VRAGLAREREQRSRQDPRVFVLSRKPAPGSGGPVQDTLRVHPCKLDRSGGPFWPSLAKDGPGRAHPIPALLGASQALRFVEGPAVLRPVAVTFPSARLCAGTFRDPGEQDVRQGAYRDVFTAFPEGPGTEARPRWRDSLPAN